MKRWGIIISVFYAAILLLLLVPGWVLISFKHKSVSDAIASAYDIRGLGNILPWLWLGTLIGGQALLLFLSVDTSRRRLRPRQHIAITAALTGLLTGLLAFAAIWSLWAGITNKEFDLFRWPWPEFESELAWYIRACVWLLALWTFWGTVFYLHYRGASDTLSAAVTWLLRGSVLELLIAVPTHVVVRLRGECSAPAVTGWGVVTGIAVMLLSFGPGILALYAKRAEAYRRKHDGGGGETRGSADDRARGKKENNEVAEKF
jgi:hypothetical protein